MRYLVAIVFLTSVGCLKQSSDLPNTNGSHNEDPIEESILTIEWATRIDPDKNIVGTDNTQIHNGQVIITGDIGDPPTLFAYDIASGEKEWTYIHDGKMTREIFESRLIGDIYIAKSSQGLFGYDCREQTLIWEIFFDDLDIISAGAIQIFSDKISFRLFRNNNLGEKLGQIVFIDPLTGILNIFYESSNSQIGYSPISYFENDSISLFLFNEYSIQDLAPEEELQSLIAIDANTKEVVWKQENYTENFACNIGLLLPIVDNVIMSGGDWSMYGFDVITGEQLWRRELPNGSRTGRYTYTNHLVIDGDVIVNDAEHNISRLEAKTGKVVWSSEDAPNCSDFMLHYEAEDVIVFSSWGNGAIMVLDAATGVTLHEEDDDDMGSNYTTMDVVYDPVSDMFSTRTFKHVVGFTIKR